MAENRAERMDRLCTELVNGLEQGTLDEDKARAFRLLWRTTPDQERESVTYSLKDLEEMFKQFRRELSAEGNKYRRIPVTTGRTGPGDEIYE